MRRVPLSLEPVLRCPKCLKLASDVRADVANVACRRCKARYWAIRLEVGDVRQQLLRDYAGEASMVDYLMSLYGLPAQLERPMYWQIPAAARYEQPELKTMRERMRALLSSIVSTHRIA